MKVEVSFLLAAIAAVIYVSNQVDEPVTPKQWETLRTVNYIAFAKACLVFVVSLVTGNYSQVDKLWSIMPPVYVWIMAYIAGFQPRQLIIAGLVTLWGVRLTFNFARKGGYTWRIWVGEEDYRWAELRKNSLLANPIIWFIFNLSFVCFFQSFLIEGFTLPTILTISTTPAKPLNSIDYIATALVFNFIILETLADEQQWTFQEGKRRACISGKLVKDGPYKQGFITTGLWSMCRHPNFFSEQAIWASLYLFSVAETGRLINWSAIGFLVLMLLFQGSTNFTEAISSRKYPAYKEYIKSTPKFIPKLW